MKLKRFPTKLVLCLVLLAMCQSWVLVSPVHGYAVEITTWINDGTSYPASSSLDPGDQWQVTWNVLSGVSIDVSIDDPDAVLLYTESASTGGSYTVTATINGTYDAEFSNPNDGMGPVQVSIRTEKLGSGVPGFNFILVLSLLGLLILFIYRKTKPIKI
ncbi:MAG: emp24/gp25L/p24 family protein [Candidatus Helarchaeota archaeon]|nr:emp24/gp25L/p24 family protein [Candidatus Helarchaeota archaeon]